MPVFPGAGTSYLSTAHGSSPLKGEFFMQLHKGAIAIALAFVGLSAGAYAQGANPFVTNPAEVKSGTYVLDPAHGKITWSVSHLGFSTYVGQFHDVAATLQLDTKTPAASKLGATVNMKSAGTFSEGLDKHLQTADFFDSSNHPTASFTATGIRLVDADSAKIDGKLTLRGVTRPVTIDADFNQAGVNPVSKQYTVGFDGRAKIKRSDFGISYGLPVLGDEVTLQLEAEFVAKPAA